MIAVLRNTVGKMHYKQVANRRKEKWQTGGREKCLSAAEPIKFLKVWLIRLPRFCVDDSNSVPNLPLPMKNIGKKTPGSSIHKLYDLRSPNSQPSELGNLTIKYQTATMAPMRKVASFSPW